MNNEQMIARIREMVDEYDLPWKYRVVLAWCVAKLMKELKCAST
jgi:hypothetical protein